MDLIVVGVDGSAPADTALRWAARQARLTGAELAVVYAYGRRPGRARSEDDSRALADKLLTSITKRNSDVLEHVTWHLHAESAGRGSPARVLMDEAEQADLIVVGSRGRGGFGELLLGSTSYRLAGRTRTPVVVLRADLPTGADEPPFPGDVVVGVDGSDTGDRALLWAAAEARRRDVTLHVLHAQPLPTHYLYGMGSVPNIDKERALIVEEGEKIIERALTRAQDALDDIEITRHCLVEPVANALVSFAGRENLIVVGSRGHGYVSGLMLGATSQQVLHHAQAPVVVVP